MNQTQHFPLVADGEHFLFEAPAMHLYDEEDLISNIQGSYKEKAIFQELLTGSSQQQAVASQPEPQKVKAQSGQAMPSASIQSVKSRSAQGTSSVQSKPVKPQLGQVASSDQSQSLKQAVVSDQPQSVKHRSGQTTSSVQSQSIKPQSGQMTSSDQTQPSNPQSAQVISSVQEKLAKTHTYQPKSSLKRPNLRRSLDKTKANPYSQLGQSLKQDTYILADVAPRYQPGSHVQGKKVLKNSYEFLKTSQVAKAIHPLKQK